LIEFKGLIELNGLLDVLAFNYFCHNVLTFVSL
jgi:hypothetical protein